MLQLKTSPLDTARYRIARAEAEIRGLPARAETALRGLTAAAVNLVGDERLGAVRKAAFRIKETGLHATDFVINTAEAKLRAFGKKLFDAGLGFLYNIIVAAIYGITTMLVTGFAVRVSIKFMTALMDEGILDDLFGFEEEGNAKKMRERRKKRDAWWNRETVTPDDWERFEVKDESYDFHIAWEDDDVFTEPDYSWLDKQDFSWLADAEVYDEEGERL